MSSFEVKAFPLVIEDHPNADAIEVARVGGYTSVVRKGEFTDGELALFIPLQALVPEEIMRAVHVWDDAKGQGKLRGRDHNRVGTARLRGTLSEGLVYRPDFDIQEDVDYATRLGITKWDPPVPSGARGQVYSCAGITGYTDIENMQKPLAGGRAALETLLGHEVVLSEKVHGSCAIFYDDGHGFHASSKGRASQGLALVKPEDVRTNWYWHAADIYDLEAKLAVIRKTTGVDRVTLYGEAYGDGVQDLTYGIASGSRGFRAFDLKLNAEYVDYDEFMRLMDLAGITTVPYLYRGVCTAEVIDQYTDGKTTMDSGHIREGVVIRPVVETRDDEVGRLVLKSISPAYKTRSGNVTEYN